MFFSVKELVALSTTIVMGSRVATSAFSELVEGLHLVRTSSLVDSLSNGGPGVCGPFPRLSSR